jgi:integrase
MAATINRLTAKEVKDAIQAGWTPDGGGLFLVVGPNGSKSWRFIFRWDGKRPELGLGAYPQISLADARRRAEEARSLLAERPKRDPRVVWAEAAAAGRRMKFGDFVDDWLPAQVQAFRNPKHRQQWENSLKTYAGKLRPFWLDEIDTEAVLDVLQPIWATKRETAQRVRGRVERILDAARARGLRSGENPARWRGHLSVLLPAQRPPREHFAAMPYGDVPAFMEQLKERQATTALCLRFIILTAARSLEARGARWDEIDMAAKLWTIPGDRMKAGKPHRVPLSDEAMAILKPLHEVRRGELVFPGLTPKKPLSETAFRALFARANTAGVTVHGFRSAFRDWCGEATTFPREVAEQALAHSVGNAVEQAYRRGDALEKRRKLMDAWCTYCTTPKRSAKVVALHG